MSYPIPDTSPSPARPWYRKKRYLVPLALLAGLIAIGALTPAQSPSSSTQTLVAPTAAAPPAPIAAPPTSDAPDPAVIASAQAAQKARDDAVQAQIKADADVKAKADANAAAAAAAAEAAKPKYAGSQPGDVVATAGAVKVSGWTATATPLKLTPSGNQFIAAMVCANVSLQNRDDQAQDYNIFQFKVQDSAGSIKDTSLFGEDALGSGSVAPGGTARGRVCFDDPKLRGQTLMLWEPDFLGTDRAVWVNRL